MRWKNVRFIIFDTGEQAALAIPVELLLADFIARASTFISGKYKIANVPGTSGAAWEGGPPIYEPTTLDHWFWLINFCRRADTNSMAMEDEHCYLHVGPHIITIRISKHVWQWVYDRGRRASEWRIVNHDSHQVYYANYAGKYKAGGGVDLRGDGPLSYPTIAKQLNTIQDHEFSSALTAKIQSHEFSSALTTITVPPDIAAIAKDTQAETRAAKEVVDLMTGLNANQTKRMRDVLAGLAGAGTDHGPARPAQ